MTENKNKASKSWCYTWNNYTPENIETMKILTVKKHRCCKEIGDNNTPHLQGAITWTRAYRLTQLKKMLPKVHWEPALTTDAENYCIKGEIIIDINNSKQGTRNDIHEACKIATEEGMRSLAEKHPIEFVKYHRGFNALRNTLASKKRKFSPLEVLVFWGEPGSGKTRMAHEIDEDLYSVPVPQGDKGSVWFDGYRGQETILFDDFYGWVKYHYLLQLTDGYNMQLQIKGGFVHKQWKRVIFTSNKPPDLWYNNIDNTDALFRRISKITELQLAPPPVTVTEVG